MRYIHTTYIHTMQCKYKSKSKSKGKCRCKCKYKQEKNPDSVDFRKILRKFLSLAEVEHYIAKQKQKNYVEPENTENPKPSPMELWEGKWGVIVKMTNKGKVRLKLDTNFETNEATILVNEMGPTGAKRNVEDVYDDTTRPLFTHVATNPRPRNA